VGSGTQDLVDEPRKHLLEAVTAITAIAGILVVRMYVVGIKQWLLD
jgi:hypothetical protein